MTARTSASVWYCTRIDIPAALKYNSMCSNHVYTQDDSVGTSGGLTHSDPSVLPCSPFVAPLGAGLDRTTLIGLVFILQSVSSAMFHAEPRPNCQARDVFDITTLEKSELDLKSDFL
ncbi:hypothetical protein T4C_5679 [Trichinella pseudospiralis]|uniref:Uncharacterized protein n=1 Tax=Trichinella pseudospiralis TaxID=6337 RepID=A0A0V1KDR0_TRIPS|nr:hypothetical protein T4E_10602 [Trichinella pseudospiralis]KRZ44997.1 hypothetical protein T4C_5679 [Trichinella pseudospiralis]